MDTAYFLALAFAVLLGLEWHFGLKSLRVGTVVLSLATLIFFQPGYRRAARHALDMPVRERIAQVNGNVLSGYESGVLTMEDAVAEDSRTGRNARWLAITVLVWLACSPVLRRNQLSPIR
jgi:hypothetical protein